MKRKQVWKSKSTEVFLIVRASARTWAVAFSQRLIPGAIFSSKLAALSYAAALASASGLESVQLILEGTPAI